MLSRHTNCCLSDPPRTLRRAAGRASPPTAASTSLPRAARTRRRAPRILPLACRARGRRRSAPASAPCRSPAPADVPHAHGSGREADCRSCSQTVDVSPCLRYSGLEPSGRYGPAAIGPVRPGRSLAVWTCDEFVVVAAVCRAHPADVREALDAVVEGAHIGHHMAPRSFCKIAGQRLYLEPGHRRRHRAVTVSLERIRRVIAAS